METLHYLPYPPSSIFKINYLNGLIPFLESASWPHGVQMGNSAFSFNYAPQGLRASKFKPDSDGFVYFEIMRSGDELRGIKIIEKPIEIKNVVSLKCLGDLALIWSVFEEFRPPVPEVTLFGLVAETNRLPQAV